MLGGFLGDMNNFLLAFVIAGAMNLVAAAVISTVKIPSKSQVKEEFVMTPRVTGVAQSPATAD